MPAISPCQISSASARAGISTVCTAAAMPPQAASNRKAKLSSPAVSPPPTIGANASEKLFTTPGANTPASQVSSGARVPSHRVPAAAVICRHASCAACRICRQAADQAAAAGASRAAKSAQKPVSRARNPSSSAGVRCASFSAPSSWAVLPDALPRTATRRRRQPLDLIERGRIPRRARRRLRGGAGGPGRCRGRGFQRGGGPFCGPLKGVHRPRGRPGGRQQRPRPADRLSARPRPSFRTEVCLCHCVLPPSLCPNIRASAVCIVRCSRRVSSARRSRRPARNRRHLARSRFCQGVMRRSAAGSRCSRAAARRPSGVSSIRPDHQHGPLRPGQLPLGRGQHPVLGSHALQDRRLVKQQVVAGLGGRVKPRPSPCEIAAGPPRPPRR